MLFDGVGGVGVGGVVVGVGFSYSSNGVCGLC